MGRDCSSQRVAYVPDRYRLSCKSHPQRVSDPESARRPCSFTGPCTSGHLGQPGRLTASPMSTPGEVRPDLLTAAAAADSHSDRDVASVRPAG